MQITGFQRFLKFSIALIVVGLVLGIAPQAQADTLTMCITDVAPAPTNENCNQGSTSGHTGSIFLDSNGSSITSSLTGAATLTTDFTSPDLLGLLGVVGPFTINIVEGNVNESPDNALDVTFNVSSSSAADGKHLWVEFATGTSFTGGAPFFLNGSSTQTSGETDVFTGCYEPSGPFAAGWCNLLRNQIGTETSPFPSTLQGVADNTPPTDPFGLGIELEISPTHTSSTSGDLSLVPSIPEPSSIVLFGTGLFVLAAWARRKRLS